MPFVTTWTDLEGFTLSGISQKDNYHVISLICEMKITTTTKQHKRTLSELIDTENRVVARGWGNGQNG